MASSDNDLPTNFLTLSFEDAAAASTSGAITMASSDKDLPTNLPSFSSEDVAAASTSGAISMASPHNDLPINLLSLSSEDGAAASTSSASAKTPSESAQTAAAADADAGAAAAASTQSRSAAPPNTTTQYWPNKPAAYKVGDCIGNGATAHVYRAYCVPRSEPCAIKMVYLDRNRTSMERAQKEIQAMAMCHHENVAKYHTSFCVGDQLWMVLRLYDGGSLKSKIDHWMAKESCWCGVFGEPVIATVLKQVLTGLAHCHGLGQMHRDIKAANILLDGDGTVTIADFDTGAWFPVDDDTSRHHTKVGTLCWMAPEFIDEHRTGHSYKVDMWSVGITAIELATGKPPNVPFLSPRKMLRKWAAKPPTLDTVAFVREQYSDYGKLFRAMVAACLQADPLRRPTASQLLGHPFFERFAEDKKWLAQKLLEPGDKGPPKAVPQAVLSRKSYRSIVADKWLWASVTETDVAAGHDKTVNVDVELISLILQKRNKRRHLHRIQFEFAVGTDTAVSIALELLDEGLIGSRDLGVVAVNLHELIANRSKEVLTFRMYSGLAPGDVASRRRQIGYANLWIVDEALKKNKKKKSITVTRCSD